MQQTPWEEPEPADADPAQPPYPPPQNPGAQAYLDPARPQYRTTPIYAEPTPMAPPRFYVRLVPPTVTRVLMGLNVAVFVIMVAYGYWAYGTINGTEDMAVLETFGAKFNDRILAGESWRLFSAMFIHIGPFHLLVNLYALYSLGPLVEGYFGHWRFLIIYLVAGLAGSLASYAFSPIPSAGASGAIFGLAGASVVYFFFFRENFGARGRAMLQNILLVIALNLVFGLTVSGIDNYGHIGGLVGGALAAYGLLPRYRAPLVVMAGEQALEEQARHVMHALWVLLLIGLLAAGLYFANGLQAGLR